jgi:hypothetical protein
MYLLFMPLVAAMVIEGTDWSYAHEEEALKEEFKELAAKARTKEFTKMSKALEKQIETELTDPVALELNRPGPDMWAKIISIYNATLADAEKVLAKQAESKCFC